MDVCVCEREKAECVCVLTCVCVRENKRYIYEVGMHMVCMFMCACVHKLEDPCFGPQSTSLNLCTKISV